MSRVAALLALLTGAILLASSAAPPHAFAQVSPTPTAIAKAVLRDENGVAKGTVYLTETMAPASTYVDHKVNLKGRITGIPAGDYALHLWEGPCTKLVAHRDRSSQFHPLHTGDLPNVIAAGSPPVINLNELSITNRFTLGQTGARLNLWGSEGGKIAPEAVVVSLALTRGRADGQVPTELLEADPDAESTFPAYCGEVHCEPNSPHCVEGSTPP